jgi:hypothetical protein
MSPIDFEQRAVNYVDNSSSRPLRPSGRRVEALGEPVLDAGERRTCHIATPGVAEKRRSPLATRSSRTLVGSNCDEKIDPDSDQPVVAAPPVVVVTGKTNFSVAPRTGFWVAQMRPP